MVTSIVGPIHLYIIALDWIVLKLRRPFIARNHRQSLFTSSSHLQPRLQYDIPFQDLARTDRVFIALMSYQVVKTYLFRASSIPSSTSTRRQMVTHDPIASIAWKGRPPHASPSAHYGYCPKQYEVYVAECPYREAVSRVASLRKVPGGEERSESLPFPLHGSLSC